MVGTVLIKTKVMPESPEINLEELKEKISKVITGNQGKNPRYEEEEVAFGLKALITYFTLKEDLPLEPIENAISEVEGVSSMQMLDMRRAVE
ncbi:Elongation factor 1-beta [uncultured archaeon]|nr:Elongation factor 1-beta [uncultured archaeon]